MARGPAPDPERSAVLRIPRSATTPTPRIRRATASARTATSREYVGTAPTNTSFNAYSGDGFIGVGCDFCHKIVDVDVSEEGIRRPNLVAGELGLPAKTTMLRSASEPWLVFGPLDDVTYRNLPDMRASHAAIVRDSRLCAACHEDHTDFTRRQRRLPRGVRRAAARS